MKRVLIVVFACLALLFLLSIGVAENISEIDRNIMLSADESIVYVGRQLVITSTVTNLHDSAPEKTVLVWSSSDKSIATVTTTGAVKGVKAGVVTITATAKDNEAISASMEIEVRTPVQSVQINEKNVSVIVGGPEEAARAQLTVTIKPESAFFQTGVWTSSNEEVVKVNDDGVVTGISVGTATVTFTSDDPNAAKKSQVNVKVGQAVSEINAQETAMIHLKKTLTLKPEVLPKEAANKKLEYISSDADVVTVTQTGGVTAVGKGEATITIKATDGSGVSTDVKVTVFKPVQSIKLSKMQLAAFAGKTSEPLTVTITPEDADYKDYIWSSSDESIATVNEKGEVTGIAGGTVKITATLNEPVIGNAAPKSVTCQVKVTQAVEYIKLEKDEAKSKNNKLVLKLTVLPETATNKQVEWSSSNKKVATVKGGVAMIKKHDGSATITATAKDGSGIYASCDIDVGFSGVVMQIGSYVYREGTYSWEATNFRGNGKIGSTKSIGTESRRTESVNDKTFLWDNFDNRDPNYKPEYSPNGAHIWWDNYNNLRAQNVDGALRIAFRPKEYDSWDYDTEDEYYAAAADWMGNFGEAVDMWALDDIAWCKYMTIRIKGNEGGEEKKLIMDWHPEDAKFYAARFSDLVTADGGHPQITTDWQDIVIDLEASGFPGMTNALHIRAFSECEIYVDEIFFSEALSAIDTASSSTILAGMIEDETGRPGDLPIRDYLMDLD